jgi:hypothetical protein
MGDQLIYLPEAHKLSAHPGQIPHFPETEARDWLRVRVTQVDFFQQPKPVASLDLITIVTFRASDGVTCFDKSKPSSTRSTKRGVREA